MHWLEMPEIVVRNWIWNQMSIIQIDLNKIQLKYKNIGLAKKAVWWGEKGKRSTSLPFQSENYSEIETQHNCLRRGICKIVHLTRLSLHRHFERGGLARSQSVT